MNGPQHFAAAEQKIKESGEVDGAYAMLTIQQAQAHATLALAAATIDAATQKGYTSTQTDVTNGVQWAGVLK
jgi:hypothetical protein